LNNATQRERARERYRPQRVEVLFVAEAPPLAADRFFYFEKVAAHDWLFLGLMRWLYEEARDLQTEELRERKGDFLSRFSEDGYFLIDAIDQPIPKGCAVTERLRRIREGAPELVMKLARVASPMTPVVLISGSVFRECHGPLKAAGVNVLNTEAIDFPSMGHQRDFARKLGRLLDTNLRDTIRDLEEAVRLWSPGETRQKERERYVVSHFLKCLGTMFEPSELKQSADDPPDILFRDARFEVKEIQAGGRRRGDEYRAKLARALSAERFADLLEPYRPESIPMGDVCARVMQETRQLACGRYADLSLRRSLDLLFYVNLTTTAEANVAQGPLGELDPLHQERWRSVSFLFADAPACVLMAGNCAPAFLMDAVGRISRP
jgi:hypothetical protein